jgi:hypothetical protein
MGGEVRMTGYDTSDEALEDDPPSPGLSSDKARNLTLLIVGVPAVAFMIVKSLPSREDEGLIACEEAIKATLKAPATYERISATRGPDYFITYDAQNSFGVPLRSSGSCDASVPSAVRWTEFPTAADFPISTN